MNKNLTDDEKFTLSTILFNFGIPPDEVEWSLSTKGHLLNKYLLQRKDFELKTERAVYQLHFSRVKLTQFKTPEPVETVATAPVLTDLEQSKGRGKGKKTALPRTSLTCLVDSLDAEKLDKLALTKDVSVSHLVRLAIKNYLKQSENN